MIVPLLKNAEIVKIIDLPSNAGETFKFTRKGYYFAFVYGQQTSTLSTFLVDINADGLGFATSVEVHRNQGEIFNGIIPIGYISSESNIECYISTSDSKVRVVIIFVPG